MVHQFADKLREGMAHEATLDSVFRRMGYTVEPVGMDAQRRGVDRLMVSPGTRRVVRVEYKADSVASRTGNAFIETVSVDTANKPGWPGEWVAKMQSDGLRHEFKQPVYLVMQVAGRKNNKGNYYVNCQKVTTKREEAGL